MQKNLNSKKIIEFENVSNYFKTGERESVTDISFSINDGDFVSFVGQSGSGKTTIMELLVGILEKSKGKIIKPEKTIMVFQKDSLLPWLTVLENIKLVLINEKISESEKTKIAKEKLSFLQIEKLANKYPNELSGGQTQRVSIARALTINPDVLILDEPFAALDEKTKSELHEDILKTWKENNLTIIMVSHQIEDVVSMSQKVFVVKDKKIAHEYDISFDYPRNIEDEKVIKKILEIRKAL